MDTLNIFGTTYSNVTGIVATDNSNTEQTYVRPQGSLSITANGTGIDVTSYATVDVNIGGDAPAYQSKTVNPTESQQTVVPDANYDALSSVTVNAISNTYVGTSVARKSGSDLTVSGATVTVPAGYYSAQATKAVATGTATTPATTLSFAPAISVNASGLITATVSGSSNVTPTVSAGYVSAGTAGKITVSGSNTSQLTTKAAATINTSTADQTIASGRYLTGTQTIKAVTYSGLSAANIADGVIIKIGDANDDDRIASVTGTLKFVTYYTGSTAPASSLGNDGDIYLQT